MFPRRDRSDGHVPIPNDRTAKTGLDQSASLTGKLAKLLKDVIETLVMFPAGAEAHFICWASGNLLQIDVLFRKGDHFGNSAFVAPGHHLIPTARIGRLLL